MARPEAHRKFYEFSEKVSKREENGERSENSLEFLDYISNSVIGNKKVFSSPFGPRKVTYCDYIASGRSLSFIEDYIKNEVLPQYGSTHTTSSVTALQTTLYRHESRDIIRNATQAGEHDRVLFIGSGATGAMQKLLHGLNITKPPVVFVDPFTHHSSLLPWREIGSKIIRIRETSEGSVDMEHLEKSLQEHQNLGHLLIGCFTAASNVTGIINDDVAITILLHKYGSLAFWDYATAAPYTKISVNPIVENDVDRLAHKDAIFFSLHKFIGGVQTPGILIAKNHLFKNQIPQECGGGTVFFVSRESHRYLQDVETREEGGTPAIVEAIRGGMVMQLKMSIKPETIMLRNKALSLKISDFVKTVPELIPLGNIDFGERLPILSFMIQHKESGRLLHHNFVAALLNDLFGIQARGGCACAGPYAQDLMGLDEKLAQEYEALLVEDTRLDRTHLRRRAQENSDVEVLRPGFVRLNLPYTASNDDVDFILNSLAIVSTEGWKLLPQYNFNPETGEWKHFTNLVFKERQWLQNISYQSGKFSYVEKDMCSEAPNSKECITIAEKILSEASKMSQRRQIADDTIIFNEESAKLRWFLLPSEAKELLNSPSLKHHEFKQNMPFVPPFYPLSEELLKGRKDFVWEGKANYRWTREEKDFLIENNHDNIESKKDNSTKIIYEIDKENKNKDQTQNNEDKISFEDNIGNIKKDIQIYSLKPGGKLKPITNPHSNKKGKIVCEDLKCFIKRDDSIDKVVQDSTNNINDSSNDNVNDKPNNEITHCLEKQMNNITLKKKNKWHAPPKTIFNPTVEAIQEFSMIKDGDKILVCLSGGKDSLSLLHTLHQYQFYASSKGIKFSLGAVTIDPMSASYDPRPLIPYLASLGVPYFFEQQDILQQAADIGDLNSICSFCSRMKRGRIYACARREGYNVLAFGQHLDDLTESFVMSIFHNGRLRTMKAHYNVKEEDLRVIRPFVYVREKDLRNFAETRKLPIIPENCPACFESPKERHRTKQMLAAQEVLFPQLYWSLRTALRPLMAINATGMENAIFGKNGMLINFNQRNFSFVNEDEDIL